MTDPVTAGVVTKEYFGGCPKCGKTDGFINVGPKHWFICDEHKTTWLGCDHFFSGWHHEDDEVWERNKQKLETYAVVEPVQATPKFCERCGVGMTYGDHGSHSPLCRYEDRTPTELSDEAVKLALTILERRGMHTAVKAPKLEREDDEIPF